MYCQCEFNSKWCPCFSGRDKYCHVCEKHFCMECFRQPNHHSCEDPLEQIPVLESDPLTGPIPSKEKVYAVSELYYSSVSP